MKEVPVTGQQIYLALVVGAFAVFIVGLLAGSLWSETKRD
jgi:hypothetical protein